MLSLLIQVLSARRGAARGAPSEAKRHGLVEAVRSRLLAAGPAVESQRDALRPEVVTMTRRAVAEARDPNSPRWLPEVYRLLKATRDAARRGDLPAPVRGALHEVAQAVHVYEVAR